MNKLLRVSTVLVLLCGFSAKASADHNIWMGLKAGTLGLGIEAAWRPLPWFDVRVGANQFDYSETGSQAGINYDGDLNMDNFYGAASFRFPLSPMRMTTGLYSNGNEILLTSEDAPTFDIGGNTYPGAAVGTLSSSTTFEEISPYLGVGFDFDLFDKVGMSLDFGVLWQGDPNVTLEADGILGSDPLFLDAIETERQQLESEMEDYKAWPVISVGFNYKFM